MVHAECGFFFLACIHSSRTWMSGSFESMPWDTYVHRLDLGLYSHPKHFLGNGVRTPCQLQGKNSPQPEAQRRIKSAPLHHTGQQAQHITNWAIPAPNGQLLEQKYIKVSDLCSTIHHFYLYFANIIKLCWSKLPAKISLSCTCTHRHRHTHYGCRQPWRIALQVFTE